MCEACVLGNKEGKVEHGAGRSRPGGDVRVRSEGKKGTVHSSIQDKNGESCKKYKDKLFFFFFFFPPIRSCQVPGSC